MSEIKQVQDSRRTFINTLNELAETDPNIVLVTADVGFNYLVGTEKFKVLNLGITEYSSCVISATLALSGFRVYFYSMVPFVTFRVHEQIRNAICCHGTKVVIAGVKGGPSYKMLGPSHNLLTENEDIDMMEKMPGFKCYKPTNNEEVKQAILDSYQESNSAYIRLG